MYNNNINNYNTSIATNNLQSWHSQNHKADANRNDCKLYDNSVPQVNKSHITDEQPCFIEPIILPPSRYQIQRQLHLTSVNIPLTNATMDRSRYYTDNNIKRYNYSTIDDTSNCCEVRSKRQCCNNNQFNASRQSSDMTTHVCVNDARSRRISHEQDCPSDTRSCVNNQCDYNNTGNGNTNECGTTSISKNVNNTHQNNYYPYSYHQHNQQRQ